jgi:hypothetical protein
MLVSPLFLWFLIFCFTWILVASTSDYSDDNSSSSTDTPVASFPLQFTASLTITSHLIAEDNDFPPRYRRMTIYYDYVNLRARADIEKGYEAAKTHIRLYDQDEEYMVRPEPINDCKRAYLGEIMPFPELPSNNKFISTESVNGILSYYFLHVDFETRIHQYFEVRTGAPVRLMIETTENDVDTPLLTYDFFDVTLKEPHSSLFKLPQPYTKDSCERHIGGFPYLHIFHYFVKF